MITAEEAREIAGVLDKEVEEILKDLELKIQEAAENKEREVISRKGSLGESSNYGGINEVTAAVIEELQKLGFAAEICVEHRQFVDLYLKVSW